jgi:hypothetical protein
MSLSSYRAAQKDAASTLQSWATVVAVFVGGVWTWVLFDPTAETVPSLYITHHVEAFNVGSGIVGLHVDFDLQNNGKVTGYLSCADFCIRQLLPTASGTIETIKSGIDQPRSSPALYQRVLKWQRVDLGHEAFYVEAGNHYDYSTYFFIPDTDVDGKAKLATIEIYSNFQMATNHDRACHLKSDGGIAGPGWSKTTLFNLPKWGAT